MDAESVRKKLADDESAYRRVSLNNPSAEASRLAVEAENQRFIGGQAKMVERSMQQQDMEMQQLGSAVDRLGEIGRGINEELKSQNQMLGDLEEDVDKQNLKMEAVLESVQKLLDSTKGGCQLWTIFILIAVLAILGTCDLCTMRL